MCSAVDRARAGRKCLWLRRFGNARSLLTSLSRRVHGSVVHAWYIRTKQLLLQLVLNKNELISFCFVFVTIIIIIIVIFRFVYVCFEFSIIVVSRAIPYNVIILFTYFIFRKLGYERFRPPIIGQQMDSLSIRYVR